METTASSPDILPAILKLMETSKHFGNSPALELETTSPAKLEHKIRRLTGKAIGDFSMIHDGDRILVAISGGKDSWALLEMLWQLRRRAPIRYDLVAVNIDQGYAGFRQDVVEDFVRSRYGEGTPGQAPVEYHMEYFDIASIIEEKAADATPCSLCSRLRRGSLYGLAEKLGCNKIALGHHLDDFVETFLLNTLFIGRNAAMAPKLLSDDGKHTVIRPLVYVAEEDIIDYVREQKIPIVCCQCPLMCGQVVHGDFKRRMVKDLINTLERGIPNVRHSLLAALTNVQPSHLLDRSRFDFERMSETCR